MIWLWSNKNQSWWNLCCISTEYGNEVWVWEDQEKGPRILIILKCITVFAKGPRTIKLIHKQNLFFLISIPYFLLSSNREKWNLLNIFLFAIPSFSFSFLCNPNLALVNFVWKLTSGSWHQMIPTPLSYLQDATFGNYVNVHFFFIFVYIK